MVEGTAVVSNASVQGDKPAPQRGSFSHLGHFWIAKRDFNHLRGEVVVVARGGILFRKIEVGVRKFEASLAVVWVDREILAVKLNCIFIIFLRCRLIGFANEPTGLAFDLEAPQAIGTAGADKRADDQSD